MQALTYKSPPVSNAYDWTGIYFGAGGGFGWTLPKGTLLDAADNPLTSYSYRVNGPVAGLFIGGNYQINRVVLGVEGDWQWSNLTGNNQILAPLGAVGAFPGRPFTVSEPINAGLGHKAAVRVREVDGELTRRQVRLLKGQIDDRRPDLIRDPVPDPTRSDSSSQSILWASKVFAPAALGDVLLNTTKVIFQAHCRPRGARLMLINGVPLLGHG